MFSQYMKKGNNRHQKKGAARMTRWSLTFVLSLVLIAMMATAAVFADADPDEEVRTISSATDWNRFVISVRNGDNNGSWRLEKNISISSMAGTETSPFTGTFDGNGHTLTLDISDTHVEGTAPFNHIAGATIKNLTVEGLVTGNEHVAGLVGFADSGTNTIDNVQVADTINGQKHAGAVVGHAKKSTLIIKNTEFSGKLTGGKEYAGGFMGWSDGSTLKISDSLFSGSYTGGGQFDPIGVRCDYAKCTTELSNTYYVDTAKSNLSDSSKKLSAEGEIVYIESRLPEPADKLYKAVRISGRNAGVYFECPEARVDGLKELYDYTKAVIPLGYKVFNGDEELAKGTDYKAYVKRGNDSGKTSADSVYVDGSYSFLAEGCGDYRGTVNSKFFVLKLSGGDGSEKNPYLISNGGDWNNFSASTQDGGATYEGKYLKLTSNISSGLTEPVGTSKTPFMGTFEGGGNTLTFSIDKTNPKVDFIAPFAFTKSATIKNLNIAGSIKGGLYTSGVIARTLGGKSDVTTLSNIKITASLTGKNIGDFAREAGVIGDARSAGVRLENIIVSPQFNEIDTNIRHLVGGMIQNAVDGEIWFSNCIYSGKRNYKIYSWQPIVCTKGSLPIHYDRTYWIESEKPENWNGNNNNGFAAYSSSSKPSGKICTKVTAVDGKTYYVDEGIRIENLNKTYERTGSDISLEFRVKKTNRADARETTDELVKGTDYTANYASVRNTGNYTLVISGKGNYTGEINSKFAVIDQLTGKGTQEDPYLIKSQSDWDTFAKNVREYGHTYKGQYIKLNTDVTVNANNCVGTDTNTFNGVFDGSGKNMTLSISKSGTEYMAPFRSVEGARIKNLNVRGSIASGNYASSLIGSSRGSATTYIEKVYSQANVSGGGRIGGLVANGNDSTVNLDNCVYCGKLSNTSKDGYTGGMVGWGGGIKMEVNNCLFLGTHSGEKKFHPYMLRDSGAPSRRTATATGAYYVNSTGSPSGNITNGETTMASSIAVVYARGESALDTSNSLFKKIEIAGKQYSVFKKVETQVILDPVFDAPLQGSDVEPVVIANDIVLKLEDYDGGDYTYRISAPEGEGVGDCVLTVEGCNDYAGKVTKGFRVIDLHKNGDNYYINNIEDWNEFCNAVRRGRTFEGKTVNLTRDLDNVTEMAGTEQNPFKGTFTGNYEDEIHNMKLAIDKAGYEGAAPFRYVSGATIRDLKTSGDVVGGNHTAGLVGFALSGENVIDNVTVSAHLKKADYVGGVLGHGKTSSVTMTNVVFNGYIGDSPHDGTAKKFGGGLVGWSDGMTLNMDTCLYNGTWHGEGHLHPIALRNSGKKMNTTVKDVYYRITNEATIAGNDYIAAKGVAAYVTGTFERYVLYAQAYDIPIMKNTGLYLPSTVEIDDQYLLPEGGSVRPIPAVKTYAGDTLIDGYDFEFEYYEVNDDGSLTKVTTTDHQGRYVIDHEGTFKIQVLSGDSGRTTGDYLTKAFEVKNETVDVSGVILDKESANLDFDNDEVQLKATVQPSNARSKNVVWNSDDETVATVSNDGLVTAIGEGTTGITASVTDPQTRETFTATCVVSVEKTVATIIKPPQMITGLVYEGKEQKLIDADKVEVEHGSMVYRIGEEGDFSSGIPTAKEAGVYTVYYYAQGDRYHSDTDIGSLEVPIAKAPFPGEVTSSSIEMYRGGSTLDLNKGITGMGDLEPEFRIENDQTGECSLGTNGVLTTGDNTGMCTISVGVRGDESYESAVINVAVLEKEGQEITITQRDVTYGDKVDPQFEVPEDAIEYMQAYTGIQRNGEVYNSDIDAPTEAGEYSFIVVYETESKSCYGMVSFKIEPKPITDAKVTLADDSLDYNGNVQTVDVVSAMLDDEDILGWCSVSGNSEVNAGEHTVTLTAMEDSNYIGTATANYMINRIQTRVVSEGYSGVHDGKSHSISVSVENAEMAGAKVYYSANKELDESNFTEGTPIPPERTKTGTTKVYFYVDTNGNVEAVPKSGSELIEITKKPFPATASDEVPCLIYGNSMDVSTLISDVPAGMKFDFELAESSAEGCTLAGSTLKAGESEGLAIIIVSVRGDEKGDYETASVNVQITPKARKDLTVTQAGAVYGEPLADPEYDKDLPGITQTVILYTGRTRGGDIFPDTNGGAGSQEDLTRKPTEAGEYKVTVICTSNSEIYSGSADFVIEPKDMSDAEIVIDTDHNDEYDGTVKTKGVQAVNLGDKDIKESCTITGDSAVNAGTKTIVAEAKNDSNYTGFTTKDWNIGKVKTFISISPEAGSMTYGQTLESCKLTGGSAVSGGGQPVAGSFKWSDTERIPDAGNDDGYSVSFVPDDPYNYTNSHEDVDYHGVLVIPDVRKADIYPAVRLEGWVVGHKANEPVVDGNEGGGKVTYLYKPEDADDSEYSDVVPTEVGDYIVKASIEASDNYKGAETTAPFSIVADTELDKAKVKAIAELEEQYSPAKYSGSERASIEKLLDEARARINAATSIDEVAKAKSAEASKMAAVKTDAQKAEEASVAPGTIHPGTGGEYQILTGGTVAFSKANKAKSVTIPATVKIKEKTYKVTSIKAKAFAGTPVKTVTVKTKSLTKKSVKNSLKGSKVKTVKVKVGNKKTNKKFVKKYKKIFTKKNAGKKVKVK